MMHLFRPRAVAPMSSFIVPPCHALKRPRAPSRCPYCKASDGPDDNSLPSLLLGASGVMSRLTSGSAEAADAAQTMFLDALSALGVSNTAPDSADVDDVCVPSEPPFDAGHAHSLAGYAFRAYEEPDAGCYREVREATVQGSRIIAEYAFPDTELLSGTVEGTFLLKLVPLSDLPSDIHFVARINEPVRSNVVRDANFSLLRHREPVSCIDAKLDELVVLAYATEAAFLQGDPPVVRGSVALGKLVQLAKEEKEAQTLEWELHLTGIGTEERWKLNDLLDYIPPEITEFKLPFGNVGDLTRKLVQWEGVSDITLSLDAMYVPFDAKATETDDSSSASGFLDFVGSFIDKTRAELLEASKNVENVVDNSSGMKELLAAFWDSKEQVAEETALEKALKEKLPPGQMPLPSNWATLAKGVRQVENSDGDRMLREDLETTLFIESKTTDTQVWVFHDPENCDIVISFRGTETTSWMDFQTDAQIWLQRWEPGADIDLTMSEANTVGVAEVTGAVVSSRTGDKVPDDASCVHYGFLRAYHSIRDAVLHAIDMVTGGQPYRYHFTGHSLGGALAKLCSADFAFHRPHLRHRVSCVSFGAPKAGNAGFALRYNLLVKDAFRVVNDSDIVVRMPKSIGKRACERYRHVGRTVLVNDRGEIWVEGEGDVPAEDPFRERYTDANKLVEYEREMWSNLVSGQSLRNHLEDNYFRSLTLVLAVKSRANE